MEIPYLERLYLYWGGGLVSRIVEHIETIEKFTKFVQKLIAKHMFTLYVLQQIKEHTPLFSYYVDIENPCPSRSHMGQVSFKYSHPGLIHDRH